MSDPAKIGMFFLALDNDYQDLQRDVARVAAARHHFSLLEVSAFNNGERQVRQIQECLGQPEAVRVRAIVVCPVVDALMRPLAEDAARLGVGFVVVNRPCDYLVELRAKFPKVSLFGVTPDHRHVGMIQGRQYKRLLPKGGSLLYITGTPAAMSAQLRLEGVKQELTNVDIKMAIETGDWTVASGERAIQNRIQAPGAFTGSWIVGAQNDLMAMGAHSALVAVAVEQKRAELANIPVTGCDGTRTYGQTLVRTRKLAATVVVPATAERAVDELAKAFSTGRPPTADILLEADSFRALDLVGATTTAGPAVGGRRSVAAASPRLGPIVAGPRPPKG